MNRNTRYILHPGDIITKEGKQYIGSRALMRLYNVQPEQCYTPPDGERFNARYYEPHLTHLHPLTSGQYPDLAKAPADDRFTPNPKAQQA